jgi:hypothetical protein
MHLTSADLDEVKDKADAIRRATASGLMVTVPCEEVSSPPADAHLVAGAAEGMVEEGVEG